MPKFKPIIADRSRLEQYATCPRQGYLSVLFDALKAQAERLEIFPWEQKRLGEADPSLIEAIEEVCQQSTNGRLAECGTQIHEMIDNAFEECGGDIAKVPEWFVDNLPSIKPNIQPMAIRHARHIADMLSEFHVSIIGLEVQVDLEIIPEIKGTPSVVGTTAIDLLASGLNNSLHVADWKTGFKRRSNSETLDSFQARFIALLLFCQKEYAEINTIHFWYYETMFGTKAYAKFERNEEHPRLPGLTTLKALKGQVREAAKLLLSDCRDAWPLPDACAWCDMIRFCPLASMDAKEIADDPKAFVDNLVVLQALCKKRKAIATAWVKGKGAIEGTKFIFGQKKSPEKFNTGFLDKAKAKGPALTGDENLDNHFS